MHEPKILILDEPTSGLDPIMQDVFYNLLKEEKNKGNTIFYSTHILNEFVEYNSDINGTGSLDKILEGYTFEEALERCLNLQYEEYAQKLNRSQSKTFLLIREKDNKIIGSINVRWNLTEEMKKFGGNIGYCIRPTERKKGYNKINLYLGLIEAQILGLQKVMLDCDVNNIASSKTMESLGGILERTEIDPYDGILTSIYWIDVPQSINEYKEEYQKYIK